MRKNFASAMLALLVLAGAASVLAACNTTRGFGEDLSSAGQALSNSAQEVKQKM